MLMKVTPEMAQEWVETYTGAKDLGIMRPIRPNWVAYLAKEMLAGRFSSGAAVRLVELGNMLCIVNGNHTLRAIAQSGVPVVVSVEKHNVATVAEVRHLYATFDKNVARRRTDSFRAYDAAGELEVLPSDVSSLASAVQFMLRDFSDKAGSSLRISDADLLAAMKPWVPAFGQLLAAVGRTHSNKWHQRIVRRQAVCSVALVTLRHQPDMAYRFWGAVAEGVNLKRHSPALRLREYLIETTMIGGSSGSDKPMESARRMARITALCWNKHFQGETLARMRINMDKPVEILTQATPAKTPVGPEVTPMLALG